MSECPDIEMLQPGAESDPAVAAHIADCPACQKLVAMLEVRAVDGEVAEDCAEIELLLAARDSLSEEEEVRVRTHLALCAECARVAGIDDTAAASASTNGPGAALEDAYDRLPTIERTHYRLGPEVARGGMGRISEAEDKRLGRQVAIKELLTRDPAARQRFKREALVTAGLQHPAIVPVYEAGRWPDGEPFYAMKRVEGRSLREVIEEAKTDAERIALVPNVLAVAEAMAYAHSKRVIHRDLKPSNILVGEYGETVVIDWGLAKDLASDEGGGVPAGPYRAGKDGLTVAGTVVGTPAFMSPEQADGKPVDERADVYALGAILYHVLGGVAPYRGKSSDEVLSLVLDGPPLALRHLAPRAPRDLLTIVDKAMSRNPADRYPTAGELAEDLRRFQEGQLVAAHEYTRGQLLGRWLRRHRGAVGVAAILLIVLAATGFYSFRRIVSERNEARSQRSLAVNRQAQVEKERDRADETSLSLLGEHGRRELLAGRREQALVYLSAAYSLGDDSVATRFLLHDAMKAIDGVVASWPAATKGSGIPHAGHWFTNDDRRVVTVDSDRAFLEIHDAETGELVRRLEGEEKTFLGASANSDGSLIVAKSEPKQALQVWDVKSGTVRCAFELPPNADHPFGVFTHDGRSVVGVDGEGFSWWDVETCTLTRQAKSGGDIDWPRVADADGRRLVAFDTDGKGRVWDLATGRQTGVLAPYSGKLSAYSVEAFSRDNTAFAAGTEDGKVLVWDLATGKRTHTLDGHTGQVWGASFSRDGKRILSSGTDGTARLWDADTGAPLQTFDMGGGTLNARFAARGNLVLTSSFAQLTTEVWEALSGVSLGQRSGLSVWPGKVVSTDGNLVAFSTAVSGGVMRVWGTRLARLLGTPTDAGSLAKIAFTLDDHRIITANEHGIGRLWDARTGRGASTALGIAARTGTRMTARTGPREIALWDVDERKPVVSLGSARHWRTAQFSDDGAHLLFARKDGTTIVYLAADGATLARLSGADAVAVYGTGERVATVRGDGTAALWSTAGEAVAKLKLVDARVERVSFNRTGSRFVVVAETKRPSPVGSDHEEISLWDSQSGRCIANLGWSLGGLALFDEAGDRLLTYAGVFDARSGALLVATPWGEDLTGLLFIPTISKRGGRIFVGHSGVPRVLDTDSGEVVATFEEMPSLATYAIFNEDEDLLVTLASDSRVRVWDIEMGRMLAEHEVSLNIQQWIFTKDAMQYGWGVIDPSLSSNGDWLLTGTPDGTVRIFDMRSETRSPEEIAKLVAKHVPYRLEDGQLVAFGRVAADATADDKVRVASVKLVGTERVTAGELLHLLPRPGQPYAAEDPGVAKQSLFEHYWNRGYINVLVHDPKVTYSPDRREVYIEIRVEEGPQYRFGEMKVVVSPSVDAAEYQALVDLPRGEVFSKSAVERVVDKLTELHRRNGQPDATINPVTDADKDALTLSVTFEIKP